MEPLRREVLPPRQPAGLLGPLFVLGSTLALAMAMAAMALAPRPRAHPPRPRVIHFAPTPRIVPAPAPMVEPHCRAAIYRPDGAAIEATFESCAPRGRHLDHRARPHEHRRRGHDQRGR